MVVESLPTPIQAQAVRIPKLWGYLKAQDNASSEEEKEKYDRLVKGVLTCNPNAEDIVIYVSKVFAVDRATGMPCAHPKQRIYLQ